MIPMSYSFRNLLVRRTTSLVAVGGLSVVAFLFAGALMAAHGVRTTMERTGNANVAIVLRKDAGSELSSSIEGPNVSLVVSAARIPGAQAPACAAELVGVVLLGKKGTEGLSNVQVRGISAGSFETHPNVQIVAGRAARPGTDEVIVGRALRGRFVGTELGDSFALRDNRPVQVVGVFSAGGSVFESEVWADLHTAQDAFSRAGVVSSVRTRFASPSQVHEFRTALQNNPQLSVSVIGEPEYYKEQSEGTGELLLTMGLLVAAFCSIGAMIAATLTIYTSVDQRRREIGTLRALGFTRKHVLASILLESFALAVVGSTVGTLASLLLSFVKFSMLNSASWSEMVFGFQPTPAIVVTAISVSGAMGFLGGILPAWGAARMNPAQAMRA